MVLESPNLLKGFTLAGSWIFITGTQHITAYYLTEHFWRYIIAEKVPYLIMFTLVKYKYTHRLQYSKNIQHSSFWKKSSYMTESSLFLNDLKPLVLRLHLISLISAYQVIFFGVDWNEQSCGNLVACWCRNRHDCIRYTMNSK